MTELDSVALALLDEKGYFNGAEYESRAGVSHRQARAHLVPWREAGLLAYHTTNAPPHYTVPDAPPALGREARWLQVAQPQLDWWKRIVTREYAAGVAERQADRAPRDPKVFEHDLVAWVKAGRLQAFGKKGKERLYLTAGVEPYQDWQPQAGDPIQTRLHRWTIARSILQGSQSLTVQTLSQATSVSESTASRDLRTWIEAGLLERHGSGTAVHWTLTGNGPTGQLAPRRSDRVERILEALNEKGAITVEEAMSVNHCAKAVARRDLNTAVLAGRAVRVTGIGIYVRWPLPEALSEIEGGERTLSIARKGLYDDQDALLREWRWKILKARLPVTPDEAAQVWDVGRPAASKRLAALVASGILRRIEDRPRPDRFDIAAED